MKLKRDISSNSAPAPEQIEVGELLINSNTGILYSKKVDGTVIKWTPNELCNTSYGNIMSAVPVISFEDTGLLCCNGGAITVIVNNLVYNNRYRLTITDLNPSLNVVISSSSMELMPLNNSNRSVTINLGIPSESEGEAAILKISIFEIVTVQSVDTDVLLSESILSTTCKNC